MKINLAILFEKIRRKLIKILLPELALLYRLQFIRKSEISSLARIHPMCRVNRSEIGHYTYLADGAVLNYALIGKYCSIGPDVILGWGVHPTNSVSTSPMFYSTRKQNGHSFVEEDKFTEIKPVRVGNDVFIGMRAIVLDGVCCRRRGSSAKPKNAWLNGRNPRDD